MSDTQSTQWLLSVSVCTRVNNAMKEFTDTACVTSDQHKDMTKS